MTMTSSYGRVVYRPDNMTTVFSVPFRFFSAADLVLSRVSGAEQQPVLTGFTVSGANNPAGGTIIFDQPPTGSASLVILRKTPHTQNTAYPEGGRFPAGAVENDLDRVVAQLQDLQDGVDRSIKAPLDGSSTPDQLGEELFAARDAAQQSATAARQSENAALNSHQLAELALSRTLETESRALQSITASTATSLNSIQAEGLNQCALTLAQGDIQIARLSLQGDHEIARVTAQGDHSIALAAAEADRSATEANRATAEADRAAAEADRTTIYARMLAVEKTTATNTLRMTKLELALLDLQVNGGSSTPGNNPSWDETGAYIGPVTIGTTLVDLKNAGILFITEAEQSEDMGALPPNPRQGK